MKVIGGFYELLIPEKSFDYHEDAIALSNGRACIRLITKNLNIKKCYVPNYTCDAVYHPFDLEGVPYELYSIRENMEPETFPNLAPDEYFYYINYFGVKSNVVEKLYGIYGNKLIIDNTHDFFKKRQHDCWSFTSARKYFGVPDGAFLYAPKDINSSFERFDKFSLAHSLERLRGNQEIAFRNYQDYEKSLTSEINKISLFSEKTLSLVDIKNTTAKRKENFHALNKILENRNKFTLDNILDGDVPFAYPFLPSINFSKESLYGANIFVPTLWADPLKRDATTAYEKELAENLMPLPIDERYTIDDMKFMAEQIIRVLENA